MVAMKMHMYICMCVCGSMQQLQTKLHELISASILVFGVGVAAVVNAFVNLLVLFVFCCSCHIYGWC